MNYYKITTLILSLAFSLPSLAQVDESKMGAWYQYIWNANIGEKGFGLTGDFQYRDWQVLGDMEQFIARAGITYKPANTNVKFVFGYANFQSGVYGDVANVTGENRMYQDILLPQKVGNRFYLNHRFRYEQRWVENQNFRTRWRYTIFMNIPLNQDNLKKGAVYLAFFNEIFINGERNTGTGSVELFDRNWFSSMLGYSISDKMRIQTGVLHHITDGWSKSNLQITVFQNF